MHYAKGIRPNINNFGIAAPTRLLSVNQDIPTVETFSVFHIVVIDKIVFSPI